MLTTTLSFRTEDLVAIGLVPRALFERYEEVELLETLRLEKDWRLQLLRIKRRGPLRSTEELEKESRRIRRVYGLRSFEVVERRTREREWILLARQKNPDVLSRLLTLAGGLIVPTTPFRIDEERTVATFRGEPGALRRVLGRLKTEGLPYRILRSSRRTYPPDMEGELTRRQRAVLERAWVLGYFSVPRRISLTRLSRLTGQSPPALGKMLRRAERWLVARFLNQTPLPPTPERAATTR